MFRNAGRKRRGGAGQSLVEFSLILFPLFFVLLGSSSSASSSTPT
jgi:Flp pilus assembly protein TadG